MNERFIRCSECGLPHEEGLRTCPSTGRVIVRAPLAASPAGQRAVSSVRPAPAPPQAPQARPAPGTLVTAPTSRAGRESVDFDLIGTLIGGKYRVRDILGQGGMGTVFEALREGLGNMVAVKVLHPNQLQKKDSVQRFHQEARAAARIGHPNICEVYDVGTLDDGRPYLVMDRLQGVTLADRIQSLGGLPFQEVIDTLTQVLSGLHAAHETGIIHRDIKPENVFLTQRVGCPPLAKILDFGVSKAMPNAQGGGGSGFSEVEVTRTGIVLGTPYYLAPEQARGERNLDARVDLYACGIMLYEALTGRRPFRAANYNALLIAILTTAPRPAREIRPDIPAGFGRILDKSIERDPNDRFQTALEFQAALQPYSHTPLAPRTVAPSRPPPRRSTGIPPAPEALVVPSYAGKSLPPPASVQGSTDELEAFLETASSGEVPPAPPDLVPPPFVPPPSFRPSRPPPPAPSATHEAPPPPSVVPFQPGSLGSAKLASRIPPRPNPPLTVTPFGQPLPRPPAASVHPPAPGFASHAVPSIPRASNRPPSMSPPTVAVAPITIPRPPRTPSWAPPPVVPAPPPPAPVPQREAEKIDQNFDDQETEIDLPRQFMPDAPAPSGRHASGSARPPAPTPSTSTAPRAGRSAVDAFAPRRSAPIVGPPLQPPPRKSVDDEEEMATEIMSAAIRLKLPEPPKKADPTPPIPPRPGPSRPPRS